MAYKHDPKYIQSLFVVPPIAVASVYRVRLMKEIKERRNGGRMKSYA